MSKLTSDDTLAGWFAYHPPVTDEVKDAHEAIRAAYGELAQQMNGLLPEGPDKTVALRAIREAMYHANATLACAQTTYPQQVLLTDADARTRVVGGRGPVASAHEIAIPADQRIQANVHIMGEPDEWAAAQRRAHVAAVQQRLGIERNSGEVIQ